MESVCQRHESQGKDPPEPEDPGARAPHDRHQTGAHAEAGSYEGDGLGPVAGGRVLGRRHLRDSTGGGQQRAAQSEDGDEGPVARAEGGGSGEGQPQEAEADQCGPPARPVRQPGKREAPERGHPNDRESDAEDRAGQPRLLGDGGVSVTSPNSSATSPSAATAAN